MRATLALTGWLVLLLGGGSVAAAGPADDETQRLTLPGFEISIEVPADWQVEPLISPFSKPLHPTSRITLRLSTGAASREDGEGCLLYAYSPLGCQDPVDLEAELSGIGPPWERLPTATSTFVDHQTMGDFTCVRHFSSDGADLFEVRCCGAAVPTDGWSSIAQTLQVPEQSRPVRVAAIKRNLAKNVKATNGMWSDAFGGTLVFGGDGFREPAAKRIWDPRVEAVVEELARPATSISIDEKTYLGDDGEEVLVVDTVRARTADVGTKADPDAVSDAMLAFARTEWQETRAGDATLETVPVGHYQATRAVFDDGAAPEYIVASGNTAIKLRAATDDIAQSWLSGLACHHLDVAEIVTNVLIQNRPDR